MIFRKRDNLMTFNPFFVFLVILLIGIYLPLFARFYMYNDEYAEGNEGTDHNYLKEGDGWG
jgi:hypothetical protein